MNKRFLNNVWISIKFDKNVNNILNDNFTRDTNGKHCGEWEICSGECYHLYFYEFDENKNIMYIQKGWKDNNYCCNNHCCNHLMEDIQSTFRDVNFRVKYH